MKPVIDLTKEYGLVLEGGGAKGAYQIGAWKALKEAGVKIKGVAGTSVGALNAALICMGDVQKAEELWKNISYSKVMDVDDDIMAKLFDRDGITTEELRGTLKETLKVLSEGGADITPLRQLIMENLDENFIRNGSLDFYSCTFSVSDRKEMTVDMKTVPEGQMMDMLLASCYLPVFKQERLHGKRYTDGGLTNILPVNALLDQGYENLILLRIYGIGREKKVVIPEEAEIIEIAPRGNLGNMLQFDSARSQRNLKLGYFDAIRVIYGLEGSIYYIEQNAEECYYLRQLMQIDPKVMGQLLTSCKLEQEAGRELRNYLEVVLPTLAAELKLGREWNYKELYLAMLEATAKLLRVGKFKVYTVEELLCAVREKAEGKEPAEDAPGFVHVILNR